MLAMGNDGVALPFLQFVVKVLQRRQGQARLRDLIKANEVSDEIKQHEDFTLICRVLDLTSCGIIGVSDASLGGVDRFGYPADQDSKAGKVYSQAGAGIFIGENLSCLWVPEASSTCRNAILARSPECVGSMKFYGDRLDEILGESAPSSKKLRLKQNAMVQDDRDGCPCMTKCLPRRVDHSNRRL